MEKGEESKIHIGKTIKTVAASRQMPVSVLATRLGKNYRSIYRMFRKANLDTGLLSELGEVLEHDFFAYFHSCNTAEINMVVSENHRLKERIRHLEHELDRLRRDSGKLKPGDGHRVNQG